MTLDLDELAKRAKSAGRRDWTDKASQGFDDAFTPAVCLALLARARDAERLKRVAIDVMASLGAAISLLERSPKTAAPSNKMFNVMLDDYRASLKRARQALSALNEGGPANG